MLIFLLLYPQILRKSHIISILFKSRAKGPVNKRLVFSLIILVETLVFSGIFVKGYIKENIRDRLRNAADDIGDRYSPGNTNIRIRVNIKQDDSARVEQLEKLRQENKVSEELSNRVKRTFERN